MRDEENELIIMVIDVKFSLTKRCAGLCGFAVDFIVLQTASFSSSSSESSRQKGTNSYPSTILCVHLSCLPSLRCWCYLFRGFLICTQFAVKCEHLKFSLIPLGHREHTAILAHSDRLCRVRLSSGRLSCQKWFRWDT